MPTLTIARAKGWADRFRPYAVAVDGEHLGPIRAGETRSFEVAFGQHHVQVLAGMLYASPTLRVHVDARGLALACGCGKRLVAVWSQMARPDSWIWLRALPHDAP